MTHTKEDIEAADNYAYSNQYNNVVSSKTKSIFLAGCEHKQKEMDELVEGLEKIIEMPETIGHAYRMKRIANELIQKYKR